ncbi:efflux RND transporter periplasmic adaptor subunit [Variovorax sp. M-6]|uniref:efflux RND transporter periplasmic adaptor subunit n=1 Tax=Variovorax sp. M-6 TaxID=3233041 RepID=UPI003F9D3E8F
MDIFRISIRQASVVLAIAMLTGCGSQKEGARAAQEAPTVEVAEVIEQSIIDWDEFTGRLEAAESVQLKPRVSGYIDRVAFQDGALLKKGALLFQIDPRPFQLEVRQLEAKLRQARATATRTANEAERGERLRLSNAISSELADARKSAAEEATAVALAVEAQLDAARLNLGFTRVTAPIDGRVSRAEITAGNLVNAGETVLTTLVGTTRIHAYFDVDEQTYLRHTQHARQHGRTPSAHRPVHLGLGDDDGTPHIGHLDFLDNQVNPRTGTLRSRAEIDNSKGEFTPGLFARVRVMRAEPYVATLVRDEAVGTDLGKKFVLVLDHDNKVSYRTVQLGPKVEGLRIVRSGLRQGDRIVVNGLQRVRPGMQVNPQDTAMAGEASLASLTRLQEAQRASQAQPANSAPRG